MRNPFHHFIISLVIIRTFLLHHFIISSFHHLTKSANYYHYNSSFHHFINSSFHQFALFISSIHQFINSSIHQFINSSIIPQFLNSSFRTLIIHIFFHNFSLTVLTIIRREVQNVRLCTDYSRSTRPQQLDARSKTFECVPTIVVAHCLFACGVSGRYPSACRFHTGYMHL